LVSRFLLRKCFLAKGLSVINSLGKRPYAHETNSVVGVFN